MTLSDELRAAAQYTGLDSVKELLERAAAALEARPTTDQAREMGAKGAEPTESERLLFEAWMAGHCWRVSGDWNGKTYVHVLEQSGDLFQPAMGTRQLWAAWRDRAALASQGEQA